MADTSGKNIDLQQLWTGLAEIELKMVNAGIEWFQACASQAAKASGIAGRTLDDLRADKASVSDAAQRFIDFNKDNLNVLSEVSSRIAKRYADGIQQVISTAGPEPRSEAAPARRKATGSRKKRSARAARAR